MYPLKDDHRKSTSALIYELEINRERVNAAGHVSAQLMTRVKLLEQEQLRVWDWYQRQKKAKRESEETPTENGHVSVSTSDQDGRIKTLEQEQQWQWELYQLVLKDKVALEEELATCRRAIIDTSDLVIAKREAMQELHEARCRIFDLEDRLAEGQCWICRVWATSRSRMQSLLVAIRNGVRSVSR